MALILILAGLVALDIAAVLWGADTLERFNSPEWTHRHGSALF